MYVDDHVITDSMEITCKSHCILSLTLNGQYINFYEYRAFFVQYIYVIPGKKIRDASSAKPPNEKVKPLETTSNILLAYYNANRLQVDVDDFQMCITILYYTITIPYYIMYCVKERRAGLLRAHSHDDETWLYVQSKPKMHWTPCYTFIYCATKRDSGHYNSRKVEW